MHEIVNGGIVRTPEEIAQDAVWTARREQIQAFMNASDADPVYVMACMTLYGVNVAELDMAMCYRMNVIHYLRAANCKDGFAGLKVWGESELARYFAWQGEQSLWGSPTKIKDEWVKLGINPMTNQWARLSAMDMLDRAEHRKNVDPAYKGEWEV